MAKSSALGIDTPFVHVEAYLLVGCMALFVTVQVGLLNKALVSFHALSVVATYQIMRLIVSVVGGMLYFGEASSMSAGENVGLGIGCVLCVLGTSAMAVQHADSHGEGQPSAKGAQADEAHLGHRRGRPVWGAPYSPSKAAIYGEAGSGDGGAAVRQ